MEKSLFLLILLCGGNTGKRRERQKVRQIMEKHQRVQEGIKNSVETFQPMLYDVMVIHHTTYVKRFVKFSVMNKKTGEWVCGLQQYVPVCAPDGRIFRYLSADFHREEVDRV